MVDLNKIYLDMCQLESEQQNWNEDEDQDETWEEANPGEAIELQEIRNLEEAMGYDMLSLRYETAVIESDFSAYALSVAHEHVPLPADFNMRYFDEATWEEDFHKSFTEVEFMGSTYYIWSDN